MRPIVRLILSIIVIIFVVGLLGFGISRLVGSKSGDETAKTAQSEPQTVEQNRSDSDNSSVTPPARTSTPGSTNVGNAGTAAGSNTGNLANTGPGETVALFIAITIGGAIAHNVYRRKTV